jgi:hypothetical protein
MEFRRGRGNGWFVIGVSADDEDDNEPFALEIACQLIGETPQKDGVKVIHQMEEEGGSYRKSEEITGFTLEII